MSLSNTAGNFGNKQVSLTLISYHDKTNYLYYLVEAMKRVEEIKGKRQAHHIRERQKKARAIERMKDVKEVQRDLPLIKSPAAGLKRPARDMEVEEDDEEEEDLDTSLNVKDLKSKAKSSPRKKVAKIVTEIEADAEMEEI